ncbi:MAG TPA: extracellular solute-binding protein [Acidimicrobiales bacterium]|nr:extracellular solute-binding protein [Acidimicrobiales bacterium]
MSSVPLIVYSAQGYDQAMVKAFQNATGILTELDTNSTGPLLAQIQASKNNPHWGLLWVDGQTAFAELDDEHMLVRGFEPKVDWNSLGKAAVPKDGSFVPTGVTLMAAVAYTSKVVTDPPTSWNTLLSSKWKGEIGMNTPTQSGPTYPFIAGMMNYLGGVTKGKQFFEKLKANGLVIHTTNGPTLAALASGQIKLALVQSSAAIGARHTDPNLRVKFLSPLTELPSNIGIDAKMTKTEIAEAKEFADFVLTKTGQTVMKAGTPTGDSLYYPVLQGTSPRPELPSLSSVKVQHTDPYTWGPREASINSWFVSNITK